jgi:hypothetical protein
MSRSIRKPFGTCVRYRSLKWDRRQANKGVRRAFKNAIRRAADTEYEDFLVPLPYECSHNDVWCWASDGPSHYQFRNLDRSWNRYCLHFLGSYWYARYELYSVWPPVWCAEIVRK